MPTITIPGYARKNKTRLNSGEESVLAFERAHLELLWACAENRFNHDFKAFLALKVNHFRGAWLASRRESSRLSQTIHCGVARPAFLSLPGLPENCDETMFLDGPGAYSAPNPPVMDKVEKERLLCLHHEAANETLDRAAQFGLRVCRRIAAILYKSYGGIGRLEMPGTKGTYLVSTDTAAELISQRVDQQTFAVVLVSASELAELVGPNRHWIRPALRKECIGVALTRLIQELGSRRGEK